nr:MAG TPA: hypothetical protein [Bacteriophage sp.]
MVQRYKEFIKYDNNCRNKAAKECIKSNKQLTSN